MDILRRVSTLPEPPQRPGGPRPRAARARRLSVQAIVDTAIRVVDAEGLDALTMRRVGEELGTGSASLYAHVSNKEQLLDLVMDRVIGEMEVPSPPDPDRWEDQLKEAVRHMRSVLAAHRDLARAALARIPLGENALTTIDGFTAIMRAAGLPDQVVAYASDVLPLYVTAVVYEESIYAGRGVDEQAMEEYVTGMRRYFESLPPDRFPNVVALAIPLTSGDGDERFEFGLDVLVSGIAAQRDRR